MPACSVAAPSRGELVDDVVAIVDVKRLASDEARRIVREERGGDADIVDPDQAAGQSFRNMALHHQHSSAVDLPSFEV